MIHNYNAKNNQFIYLLKTANTFNAYNVSVRGYCAHYTIALSIINQLPINMLLKSGNGISRRRNNRKSVCCINFCFFCREITETFEESYLFPKQVIIRLAQLGTKISNNFLILFLICQHKEEEYLCACGAARSFDDMNIIYLPSSIHFHELKIELYVPAAGRAFAIS